MSLSTPKAIKLADSEFDFLVKYVGEKYGIDLSKKRHLIEARLQSELKALGFSSYSQYIDMLKADRTGEKIDVFINKITTNYSYFSREADHYDFLSRVIVPEIESKNKKSIKIWSAGCSTGQEPYNIAMALDMALGAKKSSWNIQITATDISLRALAVARKAVYPEGDLKNMPSSLVSKYMKKLPDGDYAVVDSIKNVPNFSRLNLMDSFPYTNTFDVIFCRNVMIYFPPKATEETVRKFFKASVDGGYFFLSHSETISKIENCYTYISPSIYRKTPK